MAGPGRHHIKADCHRCAELVRSRRRIVHGYGHERATLLIVGRAPGRAGAEDTGIPFSGDEAGRRLQWMMARVGLAEVGRSGGDLWADDCFLTNAVRCSTPGNRPPRVREIRNCRTWLAEEILRVDPIVIVPVGGTACRAVFGLLGVKRSAGPRSVQGRVIVRHGYRIYPMGHLLRLRTDRLREFADRLTRVLANVQPVAESRSGRLNQDYVDHVVQQFRMASRIADERAAQETGANGGERFWETRMRILADIATASLRRVHLREGAAPDFRFLGEVRGQVFVRPFDSSAGEHGDLKAALSFEPNAAGVFEYWLLYRHLWQPSEIRRYEIVFREQRLLERLEPETEYEGRARALEVREKRRLLPPEVVIHDEHAILTVLLWDRESGNYEFRIDTLRIDFATGAVTYVDREVKRAPPRS